MKTATHLLVLVVLLAFIGCSEANNERRASVPLSERSVSTVLGIAREIGTMESSTSTLSGFKDGVRTGGSRKCERGQFDYWMDELAWLEYSDEDLKFTKGAVSQEPVGKNGGCHIDLSIFRKVPAGRHFSAHIARGLRSVTVEVRQQRFKATAEKWFGDYVRLTFQAKLRGRDIYCRFEVTSKDDSFNCRIAQIMLESLAALDLE